MIGPLIILGGLYLLIRIAMSIDMTQRNLPQKYDNKIYNVHSDGRLLFCDTISGTLNYLDSVVGCTNASEAAICDDAGNVWRDRAELNTISKTHYVINLYSQSDTTSKLITTRTYHLT